MFQRSWPLVVLCWFSAAVCAEGNRFARIAGDVEIPVPADWHLATDTSSLPAQLIYFNDSAEVLVFRSEIARNDMITDEKDLKKSVDLVINDVIKTLPEGQLRVSSGFYEGFRTGFVLEFASRDSVSGVPLEHRIRGVIYRLPDNRQVLFTIWGKAAASVYPRAKDAVKFVQDGFAYRGEYEKSVFGGHSMSYWPLAIVAMGLLGLLLLRFRRRKAVELPLPSGN